MTKKEKFQVFLFLIHTFEQHVYICPVAMLRQLKIEENVYEKNFEDFLLSAAGVCGL